MISCPLWFILTIDLGHGFNACVFSADTLHGNGQPNQAAHGHGEKEHPGRRPQANGLQKAAKNDGADKSTQSTDHANDTANYPNFAGEVFWNVFIDGRFPNAHAYANDEHEDGEDPD